MNDAITATSETHRPSLHSVAGRIGQPARQHSPTQARTSLDSGEYPLVNTPAERQAREDKSFYIPDRLSDRKNPPDPESFSAAVEHAKHLVEAQALVGDATHLVRMIAEALCDSGDRRAMQTEVACNVIERKLRKAYNRIDEHDRRHTRLFLAYFDLKHRVEGKGKK